MGSDSIRMGDDPYFEVRSLPTFVLPIDVLLNGGLPRNRSVEIYGDFSTLKSWIALQAIAATQARGGVCALIDTEKSFDPSWASEQGVNNSRLLLFNDAMMTGEEAVDATEVAVAGGADLVVWDSVAATLPQDEGKKRMSKENIQPARLAALMSAGLRKITSANSSTAVLFINQTRLNVGVTFGDPTAIPGGKALGFYSAYRISLKKAGRERVDVPVFEGGKKTTQKKTVAQFIRATVEKSKLSAPYRDVTLKWDMEKGCLDVLDYLISVGIEHGAIERGSSGTWVMGSKKVRGGERFYEWLEGQPDKLDELQTLIDPYDAQSGGSPTPRKRKVVRRRSKS